MPTPDKKTPVTYQIDFGMEQAIERSEMFMQADRLQYFYEQVGNQLKERRKKARLSFAELERRSKIKPSLWQSYENADEIPDLYEFAMMCRALCLVVDFRKMFFPTGERIIVI